MRLLRLVAAGLLLGVLAGFLAALLRPRTLRVYEAELPTSTPVGDTHHPVADAAPVGPTAAEQDDSELIDPVEARA